MELTLPICCADAGWTSTAQVLALCLLPGLGRSQEVRVS